MNNTFIYIYLPFLPSFFKKIFHDCFYHLPLYPLETQQISNIIPRANNVIMFFKIRALNILLWIFLFIHTFSPVISSNIHRYFNNTFHEFKALNKVITTETFNVDFHCKFVKFGLFCFFYLLSYIYIYSGRSTSRHSQAMDSAIREHLLTTNSCRTIT